VGGARPDGQHREAIERLRLINMRAVKALGLTLPLNLPIAADELID
jgi:hypothetical protein